MCLRAVRRRRVDRVELRLQLLCVRTQQRRLSLLGLVLCGPSRRGLRRFGISRAFASRHV
eukprot:3664519-Prymnesium_polylepis.1